MIRVGPVSSTRFNRIPPIVIYPLVYSEMVSPGKVIVPKSIREYLSYALNDEIDCEFIKGEEATALIASTSCIDKLNVRITRTPEHAKSSIDEIKKEIRNSLSTTRFFLGEVLVISLS